MKKTDLQLGMDQGITRRDFVDDRRVIDFLWPKAAPQVIEKMMI